MKFCLRFLSIIGLSFELSASLFSTPTLAETVPLTLERRVALEHKSPMSSLKESTIQEIRNHHHVLVPGMMNGVANFLGLYYNELKSFLDSIGAEYTYLGLPTKTSTLVNTEFLNLKLREIYEGQEIRKPILVRGHSKGGAEVLLAILRYPDLILNGIVDGVLLEQAAARGSSLAVPRTFSFLNPFSYFYIEEGLKSVHTSHAQKNLDEAFEVFEGILKTRFGKRIAHQRKAEISSKIRYVRTYQDPELFSFGTRIVLWACNQTLDHEGLSDGLVRLEDQKDDRIGSDLGILKRDHVDLALSRVSNTTEEERLAIVRAVLGQFYDESFE
jgi:hypothetical protein